MPYYANFMENEEYERRIIVEVFKKLVEDYAKDRASVRSDDIAQKKSLSFQKKTIKQLIPYIREKTLDEEDKTEYYESRIRTPTKKKSTIVSPPVNKEIEN